MGCMRNIHNKKNCSMAVVVSIFCHHFWNEISNIVLNNAYVIYLYPDKTLCSSSCFLSFLAWIFKTFTLSFCIILPSFLQYLDSNLVVKNVQASLNKCALHGLDRGNLQLFATIAAAIFCFILRNVVERNFLTDGKKHILRLQHFFFNFFVVVQL